MASVAQRPMLVGHRGSDRGVENTADAFRAGVARGYRYLETDVRVSADGVFVICHDTDTRRLGGTLNVAEATMEELRSEPLAQQRGDSTYCAGITTLREYLDICRSADVVPVIELKWSTGVNSDNFDNIPRLMDSIAAAGLADTAIILTSMRPCLEYIRSIRPRTHLQFLGRAGWDEHLPWCDSLRIDLDIAHPYLDAAKVRRCHDLGLKVNCWTVDDPALADSLTAMGVDMITTNKLPPRNR